MECLPDAAVPAKLAASVLPLRAILARRAEGVLLTVPKFGLSLIDDSPQELLYLSAQAHTWIP